MVSGKVGSSRSKPRIPTNKDFIIGSPHELLANSSSLPASSFPMVKLHKKDIGIRVYIKIGISTVEQPQSVDLKKLLSEASEDRKQQTQERGTERDREREICVHTPGPILASNYLVFYF